jgi:Fe-S cluster biogenesis protein NfuA/nitrite reductase/ring-hydroxylating ferredoxin subunit
VDDSRVHEEVEAVERLLEQLDELPEPARRRALDAVQGLLGLYGEGLRRIVAHVAEPAALAEDELLASLLLLHDLHPAGVEERVLAALAEVSPYMGSHGGGVELVEIAGGVVRVRLEGTCNGCAASTVTLKLAIEDAVLKAAPEVHAVEAVGQEPASAAPAPTGAVLPIVHGELPIAAPARWASIGALGTLRGDGTPLRREVDGARLLLCTLEDELYAYVDRCPGCRGALTEPTIDAAGALCCGGCGRRYDVRHAGQAVGGGLLALDPVPLLVGDGGAVRVALDGVAA